MKKEIIISTADGQLRAALMEDGRLVEIFIDTPDKDVKVGSIYMGRVQRVIQGMNAAFVDIGLEQDAFLHFSDVSNATDEFKELLEDGVEDFDELDDEADLPPAPAVSPKKTASQPRKPARPRTPREKDPAPRDSAPREGASRGAAPREAAPRSRESTPAPRENTAIPTESKEIEAAEGGSGASGPDTARRRRPSRRGRGGNRSSGRGRESGNESGNQAGSDSPGPVQQDMAFSHEHPSLSADPDEFRQEMPSDALEGASGGTHNHDSSTESDNASAETVTNESADRQRRNRRGRRPRRSRQQSGSAPADDQAGNTISSDDDQGQADLENPTSTPESGRSDRREGQRSESNAGIASTAFNDTDSSKEAFNDAGDDVTNDTEGEKEEGVDSEGKPRRRRRRGGRRHKRKKTGDADAEGEVADSGSTDEVTDISIVSDAPVEKTDSVETESAPVPHQTRPAEGHREGRGGRGRDNREGEEKGSREGGERSNRGERGRGERRGRTETAPAPNKELSVSDDQAIKQPETAEKVALAPVEDRRSGDRKPADRSSGRGGNGRTQGGAGRSAEAVPASAGSRSGRGGGQSSGSRNSKDLSLPTFFTKRAGEITINLERGQDIVVQVTREPYASKGVRVSTRVSLPGRFLVLLPLDDVIGVSRKIQQHKDRRRLHRIARSILPQGYGCIIRTVAEDKDEQVIREDLTSLIEKWKEVEKTLKRSKAPAFIYEDSSIANTVIRDLLTPDVSRVVIDDKEIHRQIRDYVEWAAPALVSGVELYNGNRPIFEKHGIERELEKTFQRKIYIPSGGYIIMEQTEAMMVIDVNSGRYADNKEQEMNALRTNTESAREIARQLRLRDVGGLVVVDFIDLYDEKNRRKVYDELRREMRRDRAKSVVLPMTQFGLVQITRQRIRQQIIHSIAEPCPTCSGSGIVQPRSMVVSRIERWLEGFKASKESRTRKLELQANPLIVDHLTHGTISTLAKMMLKYRLLIKAVPDEKLSFDTFRVIATRTREDITEVVSMI